MLEFYESKSDIKPEEIQADISQYYVYIRKDIRPYKILDEEDNVIEKGYKYLEAKLLNDDYVAEKVVQLEKDNQQLKEDNLTLMLALADLYELQLGI